MPSSLILNATTTPKNTGDKGVPEYLQRIRGVVFTPKSTTINASAQATPATTIQAAFLADNPGARWYAVGPMGEVQDTSKEVGKVTWEYGFEWVIRYGVYSLKLHPNTLDQRVLDQMQQFNNQQNSFNCFLVTEDYKWIGTKTSTPGALKDLTLTTIFTDARRFDGGEKLKPGMEIVFTNAKELNDGNMLYWDTQIDAIDSSVITRMNSVTLREVTALNGSRIVDIMLVVNGSTNLATTSVSAALAQTGVWQATKADGTALTVSSVSQVTVSGQPCYRITCGSTGFPTTGGLVYYSLQLPSVLTGLTTAVTGYESIAALTETAV